MRNLRAPKQLAQVTKRRTFHYQVCAERAARALVSSVTNLRGWHTHVTPECSQPSSPTVAIGQPKLRLSQMTPPVKLWQAERDRELGGIRRERALRNITSSPSNGLLSRVRLERVLSGECCD